VNPAPIKQFAGAIALVAIRIMPPAIRQWGIAMQHEVDAIERADRAMVFAFGCLAFACRQALIFYVLRPALLMVGATSFTIQEASMMNLWNNLLQHPQRIGAICGAVATGLGLVYMGIAGAPGSYLAMNVGAMLIGFLLVGIITLIARLGQWSAGTVSLALATMLLLSSLFGIEVRGATRWISLGGVSLQPSLIILPVVVICFAAYRDALSTVSLILASLALAIQPDRAMSGALAAGMVTLTLMKPERYSLIATGAALCGFIATMLQVDIQAAMPYVDQILYSSFDVHPLAGTAVLAGAGLMILPSVIGRLYYFDQRHTFAVFGVVWLAIIAAAALGNYPTPLVGYGGSAIIGYFVSLIALPKRASLEVLDMRETGVITKESDQHNLCLGLSYSK
jgi:hypothetical protein